MVASKDNKVYTITDAEKQMYIDRGFDIYDDDGNVIEYGRGKTVPYGDYAKLLKELEKLKAKEDKKVKEDKKAGE